MGEEQRIADLPSTKSVSLYTAAETHNMSVRFSTNADRASLKASGMAECGLRYVETGSMTYRERPSPCTEFEPAVKDEKRF